VYDGKRFESIQAPRINTPNTHGTGCTFSSAIAAHLALGYSFFDAVARAKDYISGAIAHCLNIGKGPGPTHHFFDLYARAKMY
jgi:hydroxymethylpyrimidine/phosphomethylpyrimidine kinase